MTRSVSADATERRTRLHADVRCRLIVDAAFKTIADSGFEGLRTRDVAGIAGINSATLHHHFETKDDLIAAVADELERRFRSEKTTAVGRKADTAAIKLECQFADAAFYRKERPELFAVYREFVVRAPRDPKIDALVARLNRSWKSNLLDILSLGVKDGSLRSDLEIAAVAEIVLNTIWGGLSRARWDARVFQQACDELLRLLIV